MKNRKTIDHYKGCLLGGAVGDALGAPVEFMSLDAILRQFGPSGITDYSPAFGKTGAITDDTQMTLFTAEGMLRSVTRWRHKQPPFETVETLGQGWIAEESLAIGIYCALVGGDDFMKGVLAVNHSGDSDSTGAITGNIMGALPSVSAIPKRYLDQLELKEVITELADDLYTGFQDGDTWWNKYPGTGQWFRPEKEVVEKHTVPFDRSYWVVPGKLMAGCYPGGLKKDEARGKLQGLIDHGIRHMVSLMEEDEKDHSGNAFTPYESVMQSLAVAAGKAVTFARFPIRDLSTPSEDEMAAILDHIDKKIGAAIPTYIHCWGGQGRTGTVVGCYLARHGMATGEDVLQLVKKLRKDVADAHQASPETGKQSKMVAAWVRGK